MQYKLHAVAAGVAITFVVISSFTIVVWAYIVNYCPSGFVPCSLMQHMTWDDRFATPLLFINEIGMHQSAVEINDMTLFR